MGEGSKDFSTLNMCFIIALVFFAQKYLKKRAFSVAPKRHSAVIN